MSRREQIQSARLMMANYASELRAQNMNELVEGYNLYLTECRMAANSDYYFFREENVPDESHKDVNDTFMAFIVFYIRARDSYRQLKTKEEALREKGLGVLHSEQYDSTYVQGNELLNATYGLVSGFENFLRAQPDLPPSAITMTGYQRVLLLKFIKDLPREKPPEAKEALRRYIPRWVTFPIDVVTLVNERDVPDLVSIAGEVDRQTTHDLISDENLEQGKLPLHLVLTLAQAAERRGLDDVGYQLQTGSIELLLREERERRETPENPEIPFFTHIFPSLISRKFPSRLKGSFYNFHTGVQAVMESTFVRLAEELASGQPRRASEFLNTLYQRYPAQFAEMISIALAHQSERAEDIDVLALLKNLQRGDFSWGPEVVSHFDHLDDRRALTNHEVASLAERIPVSEPHQEAASITTAIESLLEENDSYSFSRILSKKAQSKNDVTVRLDVELDAASQTLSATLQFESAGFGRQVHLKLSFLGEEELLNIETLDEDELDVNVKHRYFDLLTTAILDASAKVEADREAHRRRAKHAEPLLEGGVVINETKQLLSRDQRIALYYLRKGGGRTKYHKNQPPIESGLSATRAQYESTQAVVSEKNLVGADVESIQRLLDESKIEAVTAAFISQKLVHIAKMSSVSGQILGKRIDTLSVGKLKADVNLREVSLMFQGGAVPIRIFLEDLGQNTFVVRGIYLKKGIEGQQRYIDKLVGEMVREKLKE